MGLRVILLCMYRVSFLSTWGMDMVIKRQKQSRKDMRIFLRVSQQDFERIKEVAAANGINVSELLRVGALNYGISKQQKTPYAR